MKKILIKTAVKKMLADLYTPVGIYLRLRDRFRDTILLESTDHHVAENSYSFICINAIAGIEVRNKQTAEFKLPGQEPQKAPLAGIASQYSDNLIRFAKRVLFDDDAVVSKFAGHAIKGAA